MHRLSQRQTLPQKPNKDNPAAVEQFIRDMKEALKKDPIIVGKFAEYEVPLDEIDSVSVKFCPLEVSAKTKNKCIYLNESMLDDDSDVKDPASYMVHEIIHYLQQRTEKNTGKNKTDDYLDMPSEEESFSTQIDFKKEREGRDAAEKYTDDLLSYHDYSGAERKEKKEELFGK